MVAVKKIPLMTSNNSNIDVALAPPQGLRKTIEETYQKKTQLEHILLRPDTYVGSIEKHTQTLWVYENERMVHRPVTYVPGLYKIFDEILVNAADNKQRDPKMDSVKVVIDVENNMISVHNNGDGVPVEIHKEEGVYVPELIFGHLLTSSNYDDTEKKTTGGRNGYGAKLTNIFSTEFIIETADGKRRKKYKQVFSNNMNKKSEPMITKCKEGENWTRVSYKPDLEKFNMTHLEDDVVALMKKRVIDLTGCLGKTVKIELNGKKIPIKSFKEYVNLYLTSSSSSSEDESSCPKSFYAKVGERWEICVSLTEGQFQQVSFVNSIATIKGGTHVDYITNQIANHVMGVVNKKHKTANIKAHNVKNYLWVFVNALIDNPAFDSQTKETLTLRQSSFGSKCELPDDFLKKVVSSDIVESLLAWANFKQRKDLKKTDGTKTARVNIPNLDDANEAGGKNSHRCTLILTEGNSAKNLAMAGVAALSSSDQDLYGVFPLRGKLLNVREATAKQLNENREIENIKKILGLQQHKQYDSVKALRYGHLMIMADQDHDGSHIKGLVINFIHCFWPSLLKVPSFLVEFITPIVKVTHTSGRVLPFYTMPEYKSWIESLGGNAKGWTIKYYKGLGTSINSEGKEYFKQLQRHKKDFVWIDQQDGDAIELAFSKKKAEARKTWLQHFEPGTYLDQKGQFIRYSDFINKELVLFSMADLQRSIPSMVDGLKSGQRKILFSCFKKNIVKEEKLVQLGGTVMKMAAYHHGEQSLYSTIVGMAQDFVGSNNINLLAPRGQFGSRSMGGKDHASPRYISTHLSPITRFLFPKDDDNILDYLNEDGILVEPAWYVPIIPMVLVNGCEGIGTGWSTFIPNYNPRDIIANLKRLLNGEVLVPMHPWYRGFRGVIEKNMSKEEGSYAVHGVVEGISETTLRITELPIRKWTTDYKEFLTSLIEGNPVQKNEVVKDDKTPFIRDFRRYGDEQTVVFEIVLPEENMLIAKQEGLLKKFKLTTTVCTTNMHLFHRNGMIKKYDTPEDILEEFFHLRMESYDKRKSFLVDKLAMESHKLDNKVRFILGVVHDEIIVKNRKKAELLQELQQMGFTPFPKNKSSEPAVVGANEDADDSEQGLSSSGVANAGDYDYLLSMTIGTLTLENVQKLCNDRDELAEELRLLKETTTISLWLKELDDLEKQLDELEQGVIDADGIRKQIENQAKGAAGTWALKAPKKKNGKKAKQGDAVAEAAAMETESAPEVAKPGGVKGAKKTKKDKSIVILEDEDEVEEDVEMLRDRLKAYALDSSPDHSTETEPKPQARKKNVRKKPLPVVSENLGVDGDFEAAGGEQKRQKKNENEIKAAKPAPARKNKRGLESSKNKTLKEMWSSKASSSTTASARQDASSSDMISSSVVTSTIVEQTTEPTVERERPKRATRKQANYLLSDDDDDAGDNDGGDGDSNFESDESDYDSDGSYSEND